MKRREKDGALQGSFIMGLTNQPITKLLPLAKSWLQPAQLKLSNDNFIFENSSRDQRAYILRRQSRTAASLEFMLDASEDSPVVNPAFVIKNWGNSGATLKINGKEIERGKDFRFGHRHRFRSSDLIVWVKTESIKPIQVSLLPVTD